MDKEKKRESTWEERDLLWRGCAFFVACMLFAGVLLLFPVKGIFNAVGVCLSAAFVLIMQEVFER